MRLKSSNNKNLLILELLCTYPRFNDAVEKLRDKYGICFIKDRTLTAPEYGVLDTFFEKTILEPEFQKDIDKIMVRFKLPQNFWSSVITYLATGAYLRPAPNFVFSKQSEEIQSGQPVLELSIFSALKDKEIRLINAFIKSYIKKTYPKRWHEIQSREDLERDLKIERLLQGRSKGQVIEILDSLYLAAAQKQYSRGSMSNEEFADIKKKNIINIRKTIEGKTTTKDIVKAENLKISEANAKKIVSRLKKERETLFGR